MSEENNQINTVSPMPVNTSQSSNVRVDEINKIVDREANSILEDLDAVGKNIDSIIEIMIDRTVQSTEPQYAIALARLGELRVEALKKKTDVLKTLVTDKSNELANNKKSRGNDFSDIMSGACFGAALGATISNQSTQQKSPPKQLQQVEILDSSFELVDVSPENTQDIDIDNIISGNG